MASNNPQNASNSGHQRPGSSKQKTSNRKSLLVPVIIPIIVALIGTGGTIAAALIGRSSGVATGAQQAQATAAIQQVSSVAQLAVTSVAVTQIAVTQIAITQVAITQIVATSPPAPTPEPVTIIATPTPPPPTPEPDNTPPGSVLGVGDTWKQDGAELTLVNVDFGAKTTNIAWRFKNNTGSSLLVQYSGDNFIVKDEQGHVLKNDGFQNFNNWHVNEVMPPGKSINNAGMDPLLIEADLSNIKEITITAKDIARIKVAQWKVPVNVH